MYVLMYVCAHMKLSRLFLSPGWHCGSITKSMTATLAAVLREKGLLPSEVTVAQALYLGSHWLMLDRDPSHGFHGIFRRFSGDLCVWFSGDVQVIFVWFSCLFQVIFIGFSCDFHMVFRWCSFDFRGIRDVQVIFRWFIRIYPWVNVIDMEKPWGNPRKIEYIVDFPHVSFPIGQWNAMEIFYGMIMGYIGITNYGMYWDDFGYLGHPL